MLHVCYVVLCYFMLRYITLPYVMFCYDTFSYPTSESGIIVLLKTPPKYRKLDYNENKKAQKITHTLAIFVDHGIINNYSLKSRWIVAECLPSREAAR